MASFYTPIVSYPLFSSDMSTQTNVFDDALRFFAADVESIRSSAAFAAGNT